MRPTADQQLAAVKAAGIPYREYPGWRERGMWRVTAKGWDVKGITIHHTAGGLGSRTVPQYIADIINGDPGVPDKANAVIAPDGTLWLNAAGRANHHVYYSDAGLARVKAGTMPLGGPSVNLRGSRQNFNAMSMGVECIAAGTPNAKQRETAVKWAAAMCRAAGLTAGSVVGHGELGDDRDFSDPGWRMGDFRADVAKHLNHAGGSAGTTTGDLTMADINTIIAKLDALTAQVKELSDAEAKRYSSMYTSERDRYSDLRSQITDQKKADK